MNAFDVDPPHLRYQLKANKIETTQAVNIVTASQSIEALRVEAVGRTENTVRQAPSPTAPTGT